MKVTKLILFTVFLAAILRSAEGEGETRLVLRFLENIPLPDSIEALLELVGIDADDIGDASILNIIPELSMYVVLLKMEIAKRLAQLPIVRYIETDVLTRIPPVVRGAATDTLTSQESGSSSGRVNDDGEFIPWGIEAVQALRVSDDNVGNRMVCIIDSGYDINHLDLPSTDVSGTDEGAGPWFEDGDGHGTHVAGTIAAIGGNGEGVIGVNRNAELNLFIVRLFDDTGTAWASSLISLVQTCVNEGANIVSMSLGRDGDFLQFEADAYNKFYTEDGVLLIAAAGNTGETDPHWPASYNAVMSVAAIDANKALASFSTRNDQVEIAAPGVDVWSTIPGNEYASFQGTSMATPHVSGVAALIWSFYPNEPAERVRRALTGSALDLGSPGRDDLYGFGLVQAEAALLCLEDGECIDGSTSPPSTPPPSPPPGMCVDDPSDWVDSDGDGCSSFYDRGWGRCTLFGGSFKNEGKTARDVCCSCGGGISSSECVDYEGWVDTFDDGCDWYERGNRCEKYGNEEGTDGLTAAEACCACQGVTGASTQLTPKTDGGDESDSGSVGVIVGAVVGGVAVVGLLAGLFILRSRRKNNQEVTTNTNENKTTLTEPKPEAARDLDQNADIEWTGGSAFGRDQNGRPTGRRQASQGLNPMAS